MTGVSGVERIAGERPTNYALFNIIREMYQVGGYEVVGEQAEDRSGFRHVGTSLGRMSRGLCR
jgi:hypothetical protein